MAGPPDVCWGWTARYCLKSYHTLIVPSQLPRLHVGLYMVTTYTSKLTKKTSLPQPGDCLHHHQTLHGIRTTQIFLRFRLYNRTVTNSNRLLLFGNMVWADTHKFWARESCPEKYLCTVRCDRTLTTASRIIALRASLQYRSSDLSTHISSLVRNLETANGHRSFDLICDGLEWSEMQQTVS
jgi:hypothetical protein